MDRPVLQHPQSPLFGLRNTEEIRLTEHRAVAVVRPIVDGLDDLKARGSKLFDQELLRHAVAATVLRNAFG